MNCNEFMSFLLHTWKDKLTDSLVGRAKKNQEKNTLSLRFVILYKGKLLISREQEPQREREGRAARPCSFLCSSES
jgi:hypothetical protein